MNHTIKVLIIITLVTVIIACPTDGDGGLDKAPEKLPAAERWSIWDFQVSTATIDMSVDDDGVCAITVGGKAAQNNWERRVMYAYTTKANTRYTYVFEAWTAAGSGPRIMQVMFYEDWVAPDSPNNVFIETTLEITGARTIYTLTSDRPIPKSRVANLEFRCAAQLGTFYVKVLAITPSGGGTPNPDPGGNPPGDNETKTQVNLDVPTLAINTNAKTANWNAVPNANNGYTIKINANETTVNGTSYSLASLDSGTYQISVKANGYETATHRYIASVYCAAQEYITGGGDTYAIGDIGPGGGIIFYYDANGFTVEMADPAQNYTAHYLEAAPTLTGTAQWGADRTFINGVTTFDLEETAINDNIGKGRKDTALIVAHLGTSETNRAAQICAALTTGGKTDWFLPSLGELNELYKQGNLTGIDLVMNDWYWSSTQYDDINHSILSWGQFFAGDGFQVCLSRTQSYNVHAIRAFARDGNSPSGEDPGSGDPGSGDPGSGDPGSEDPGSGDPGSGDPGDSSNREIIDVVYQYRADGSLSAKIENEYDSNGTRTKDKYYRYNENEELTSYEETEYDSNGNRTIQSVYNASGAVTSSNAYEYDSNGRPIKYIYYDANGVITSYSETEWDSSRNPIKNSTYYGSGELVQYSESEYDSNGRLIKQNNYNASGTLSSYIEREYNFNGNLTRQSSYNASGESTGYTEFDYDSNGNQTKQSNYNAGGLYSYTEYEHDSDGRTTKQSSYNASGESTGCIETEYNSNGNLSEQRTYNASGVLIGYTIFVWKTIYINR